MRQWHAILVTSAALAVVVPVARHLAKAGDVPLHGARPAASAAVVNDPTALDGVQLERLIVGKSEVVAPAASGRMAHLTLDAELQRSTHRLFREHKIPDGAAVLLDVKSGRMITYVNVQAKGPPRDLCSSADAPAASVFKIVTGAALVESAHLSPQTRQCYHGGAERIEAGDLSDDPRKDKWCATLSEAMGRSLNTVFARLALRNLKPTDLKTTAGAFGFGWPVPFDRQVEPSQLAVPEGDLGYARTAAGFWNSTLSPVHAVLIAAAIASEGNMPRPTLVSTVTDPAGTTIYRAPEGAQIARKTVRPETANAVREMMEATVTTGTGYHAFHDTNGKPFLPGIKVAGKTGTLTKAQTKQFFTWFVGFAPSDAPQVAIATLAINGPKWQTKANVVARDALRAYFASKGTPGVTKP